jgi:serine/threonine-protein kinase
LVYVAAADGKTHLALRLMAEFDTRQLPGTEGAFHPFFSPDGQWVGFFTETELKKLAIAGGQVVTLCEARNPVGGSWGPDGRIYFAPDWGDRVLRVSAEGGAPEPVAAEGIWPRLFPDGRSLLVTLGHTLSPSVAVLPLDGGEPDVVIERGGDARYLPTGHLAFVRTGQLLAAPFDLERMKLTGPAVPLINGVRTDLRDGGQIAISGDGTVVYVPGPPSTEISPAWTDHQGFTESPGLPTDVYGGPMLSPDGNRLAVLVAGLNTDIWIYDLIRRNPLRLTSDGQNYSPVWTPDGLWVIYRRIGLGIFRRRANGTGDEERLTSTDGIPFSVTPDGETLLFTLKGKAWSLPLRSENRTETSVETATRISGLNRLSPDGRWMAMTSGESGRSEVYVEPYPPTGERWMISSGGGEEPVWSPRADKIYYRYGNTWMAADVTSKPRFSAGTPTFMFEGDFANSPGYSYDIHPDGRRFLVMKRGEGPPPTTLHVIHNWFEELKRLVPTE